MRKQFLLLKVFKLDLLTLQVKAEFCAKKEENIGWALGHLATFTSVKESFFHNQFNSYKERMR